MKKNMTRLNINLIDIFEEFLGITIDKKVNNIVMNMLSVENRNIYLELLKENNHKKIDEFISKNIGIVDVSIDLVYVDNRSMDVNTAYQITINGYSYLEIN
jgi:hypothetical protein